MHEGDANIILISLQYKAHNKHNNSVSCLLLIQRQNTEYISVLSPLMTQQVMVGFS